MKKKKSNDEDLFEQLKQSLKQHDDDDDTDDAPSVAVVPAVPEDELKKLNSEQLVVFRRCCGEKLGTPGGNMCILGGAGSGKTFVTKLVTQELQHRLGTPSVAILTPTGMAAEGIPGAEVIHSFLGLPPNLYPPTNRLVARAAKYLLKHRPLHHARIMQARVVVLDEIGMVCGELFDFVNGVFCAVRRSSLPFGGLQLIGSGDPFQLPPVSKCDQKQEYFFQADTFYEAFDMSSIVVLRVSVRQEKDAEFAGLLDRMKRGALTEKDWTLMRSRDIDRNREQLRSVQAKTHVPRLHCNNMKVDACNYQQLKECLAKVDEKWKGVGVCRGTSERKSWTPKQLNWWAVCREKYRRAMRTLKDLQHEDGVDLQPMQSVVNQFVKQFGHMDRSPSDAKKEMFEQVARKVVPDAFLLPGVRIVVTRNCASKGLRHGQTGVVVQPPLGTNDPLVLWDHTNAMAPLPLTQWVVPYRDGKLIYRHYAIAYAWATTIHKMQSRTLDFVILSLADAFEYGQIYSAWSRARSLSTIFVESHPQPSAKFCHPAVLAFAKYIDSRLHVGVSSQPAGQKKAVQSSSMAAQRKRMHELYLLKKPHKK